MMLKDALRLTPWFGIALSLAIPVYGIFEISGAQEGVTLTPEAAADLRTYGLWLAGGSVGLFLASVLGLILLNPDKEERRDNVVVQFRRPRD